MKAVVGFWTPRYRRLDHTDLAGHLGETAYDLETISN